MKKFIYVFLFLFLAYGSANSQAIFTENFAYTAGDSIGAHGWVYNTGAVNPLLVTAPGLIFSANYINSNIGNALTLKPTGNDAYKGFTADSVGTFYTAFMIRVDTSRADGDYFFAMLPSNSTSFYTGRTYIRDTTGGYRLGLSKTTAATAIGYSSTIFQRGTTYVVILKYQFNSGTGDDAVSLFAFNVVSGIPVNEPGTATIGPITSGNDLSNYGRVAVRQGSATIAPYMIIDGIMVTKTWANVLNGLNNTSTVAESFNLSQNYPNPFNPTTNIKFSLPSNGKVTLKVYNTLGKEVSALVNSNLSMGEYTVDFNAKGLTSGLYFYKLEFSGLNGNYISDIKKMMLVK